MIISLIREHHWSPTEIGDLFIDDQDWRGLVFLYNDLVKMHEQLIKK